jgi:hypothetical protein
MKTLATALCAIVLAAPLSSCTWLKAKYARNETASVAYLSQRKLPSGHEHRGALVSPQWGIVSRLNQEPDGKLTGIFRDYYVVNGVVSDKALSLR